MNRKLSFLSVFFFQKFTGCLIYPYEERNYTFFIKQAARLAKKIALSAHFCIRESCKGIQKKKGPV
jgi:hypothetical protein